MSSISDKCPYKKCDGSSLIWIMDHEEGRDFARECDCKEFKKLRFKLSNAQLPSEFADTTINSFDVEIYEKAESQEQATLAKRYAGNFVKNFDLIREEGKGLYLYSRTKGSGKTRLAASILNAIVKVYDKDGRRVSVYYSSTADLLGEIRRGFDKDADVKSSDVIDAVRNVDLLVLDDIGVEKTGDWVEETFTRILEHRLLNMKLTIFTSNLAIDELDSKYPEGRVRDRIKKMAFPVKMPEEQIRSMLAEKENEDMLNLLLG
ncbi:hypothetical protein BEP19_09950 [Ammoniphilus oxalaticus]|uniref:IstB-like ATP-binding domain-containing protein n=1 Tax=Ammoniphilus oxalaticus TaxID=66863 RepID=A0A419SFK8_9BACL|nr:hypothetical protein BEP19_09950 [Ammoniphilus oxalaticus]